MGYRFYDKLGNYFGERETESERKERENTQAYIIMLILGLISMVCKFIITYWWLILAVAILGFIIWQCIKSNDTKVRHRNKSRKTSTSSGNKYGAKAKGGIVKEVTIPKLPENMSYIPDSYFMDNPHLKTYWIPTHISRINSFAFRRCTELKSIDIPSSVEYIGESAFAECLSLEAVFINSTTPPYLDGGLESSPFACCPAQFYVPIESVEEYKSDEGWEKYSDRIVGYNFAI